MLFVVSMLSAALVAAQAPAASAAHISGRVLVEGANTPLADARVMLTPMHRPGGLFFPPAEVTTDQDGRYVFEAVAPGTYQLEAQHTGFAQNTNVATLQEITLAAGEALDSVDISLQRGGAIAGRIVDSSGAPLSDLRVMALRPIGRAGVGSQLAPAGGQQTNDLGEFRVYGLAAGTYYIAAIRSPIVGGAVGAPAASDAASRRSTLAPTFYPGTTDSAAAQSVTVTPGGTVSDVSFTMQSAPAFRLAGVVTDESGNPVSSAMVMVIGDPRSTVFGPAGHAQTETDGRFVIGGVPAGRYRAMVSAPMTVNGGGPSGGVEGGISGGVAFGAAVESGGAAAGGPGISGGVSARAVDVIVTDADVTGLRIVVHRR